MMHNAMIERRQGWRGSGLGLFTQPAQIHTYDDHRMAMAFALVGLRIPGVEIENPGCVAKTFPNYFEVLEQLRR